MKKIYILILFFIVSFLVSIFIYFNISDFTGEKQIGWKHKEKEIESRLLAIPILLYHNIDGDGIFSLDLDRLRVHFQLIKDRNIRVISLSELINRLENPEPFKGKVIVITFDDGYFSMYTKLLPLAKEFNYPITLFIYTDFIHTKARNGLTWEMLREMDKQGIDIQCHSVSHPDLDFHSLKNNYASRKRLFKELYVSKRIIELYLKKNISFFAYPYGRYNLNVVEMSSNSGYRRVFSTDYGSNVITRDNFCLRRQHIKRNYSLKYFEKLIE